MQVFIAAWFTAPEAIEAPHRVLALLKSLLLLFTKQFSLPHLRG